MDAEQQHIDDLLQRYLDLLDTYTHLREDLSRLQSDVYHNIARANFSGERGLRYGQDHYDDRMKASRRLGIEANAENAPVFTIKTDTVKNTEEEKVPAEESTEEQSSAKNEAADEPAKDSPDKASTKRPRVNNPLHWFGLLTPMPMRAAQATAIQAVEGVIPRLVSVNAEMAYVEIEIRRARKRRTKSQAAEAKKDHQNISAVPVSVDAGKGT